MYTTEEIERYALLLQNMSNRDLDDPLLYIITTAHKMDLQRCYVKSKFIQSCFGYVRGKIPNVSDEDLQKLVDFTHECSLAVGERKMYSGIRDYNHELFYRCSTEIMTCMKKLDSVPEPTFTPLKSDKSVLARLLSF